MHIIIRPIISLHVISLLIQLSACNDVWNNDKPHVIYGYAVVDSACSLNNQRKYKSLFS